MKWLLLAALLLGIEFQADAQLLNVEDLRLNTEKNGWYGLVNFNFRIRRNRLGRYLDVGSNAKIVRVNERNRWLAWGSYNLTRFENIDNPDPTTVDFTNVGIAHLRYNRELTKLLTWEVFGQSYFDQVQEVRERYLLGTGPRLRFLRSDTAFLNMGLIYMFEYEENTAPDDPFPVQRNNRLSSYLSGGYQITNTFGVQTVFYYQPRLDFWSDYRFSNQMELSFQITKVLSFLFQTFVIFDSEPPLGVPRIQYSISNGISISFQP